MSGAAQRRDDSRACLPNLAELSDDELAAYRMDAQAVLEGDSDEPQVHEMARRDLRCIAEEEAKRVKAGRPEMEW